MTDAEAAKRDRQAQACAWLAWAMARDVGGEDGPLPEPDPDRSAVDQAIGYLERVRVLPQYAQRCTQLEAIIDRLRSGRSHR